MTPIRQLHPCIDAGVTYCRRVGGSGAPGTPPPLGNGRGIRLSILFSPYDHTYPAAIGAAVSSNLANLAEVGLEPGQNC